MKRVKKIQKVLKEGTVDDLLEDLEVQLPSFLEHVFVKRQQARIFKEKIEHLTEEEAVVQVDFAENFSCKYQGEVQSAPWSQDQVTLFTVAIWTKSGDKNSCCESHVIVSDDLKHDKNICCRVQRPCEGETPKHNSSLDIFRWTKLAVQEQVHCPFSPFTSRSRS